MDSKEKLRLARIIADGVYKVGYQREACVRVLTGRISHHMQLSARNEFSVWWWSLFDWAGEHGASWGDNDVYYDDQTPTWSLGVKPNRGIFYAPKSMGMRWAFLSCLAQGLEKGAFNET